MTQKRADCLIADAIRECETMAEYRMLLVIAMEQLDLGVPDTLERLKILLSVYLSAFDCQHENLKYFLLDLDKLSFIISSSDS